MIAKKSTQVFCTALKLMMLRHVNKYTNNWTINKIYNNIKINLDFIYHKIIIYTMKVTKFKHVVIILSTKIFRGTIVYNIVKQPSRKYAKAKNNIDRYESHQTIQPVSSAKRAKDETDTNMKQRLYNKGRFSKVNTQVLRGGMKALSDRWSHNFTDASGSTLRTQPARQQCCPLQFASTALIFLPPLNNILTCSVINENSLGLFL